MKILSIDTSCDETSAAVTEGVTILSNVLWSQASMHAKWGGVYPSLAKRAHEERIDYIVEKSLKTAFPHSSTSNFQLLITNNIDAIAVTIGPGLAIALEVGINKARELAKKYNKPFIPVNHIEGHILSSLARPRTENLKTQMSKIKTNNNFPITNNQSPITFPALTLVTSGKHTDLIVIKEIGKYEILASTVDDALGEALDKAVRMMGLGYPGGPVLEKFARSASSGQTKYSLPIPLVGQESKMVFSYSGLKTAMYKLVESVRVKEHESISNLTKQEINDLCATFQDVAFKHVERVLRFFLANYKLPATSYLLFGGGVSANIELRKRLRRICKEYGMELLIPYTKKLCTDNAAMIGVAAYFKYQRSEYLSPEKVDPIDRLPRVKVDEPFPWEKYSFDSDSVSRDNTSYRKR